MGYLYKKNGSGFLMRMLAGIFILTSVFVSFAFSRPAEPGTRTVRNGDGSSVSIRYFGDEHYHYAETTDGFLVAKDDDGNYVYVDENGKASSIVARNAENRSAKDKSFLKTLNQETVHQRYREQKGGRFLDESDGLAGMKSFSHLPVMSYNQNGKSVLYKRESSVQWTKGSRWFPVLLVGTGDKPYGDSAKFHDFFNKSGYSENKGIGSMRDYFLFVSDSLFDPHFDVYPVQLEATLASFGKGENYDEVLFVTKVIDELAKRMDFQENVKRYCSKNSKVDAFFFLYPGREEEATQQSEDFWAHRYMLRNQRVSTSKIISSSGYWVGGYYFDDYVFFAQYADGSDNKEITKLGVFVHEFSHVMGLHDHYSKDENGKQHSGPASYDIMSTGMYNGTSINAGNAPMGYSAFEKEVMGWLKPQELEPEQVYTLEKASKLQAYSVTNPNQEDEFYVVEYRPAEKFDAYVRVDHGERANGVYVWYIDYDEEIFADLNEANKDPNHQRVALKAVLGADDYYVDFSFVNGDGLASVPGVYNVALAASERACFSTSDKLLPKNCVVESSSSAEAGGVSSSSSAESVEGDFFAEIADAVRIRVKLEGAMLHVMSDDWELKEIRLFDIQGHLLYGESFTEKQASLDLSRLSRGIYVVRITEGKRILGYSKIRLER